MLAAKIMNSHRTCELVANAMDQGATGSTRGDHSYRPNSYLRLDVTRSQRGQQGFSIEAEIDHGSTVELSKLC